MSFPVWAAFALLFLEYASLGVAFDAQPLGQRTDGWAVAGPLGSLAALIVCAVLGVALVLSQRPLRASQLFVARRLDARAWAALAIHALAFALLWWLTARIFSPDGPPEGQPFIWLTIWAMAAFTMLLCAVTAALPVASQIDVIRTAGPACAGGAVIGIGGWLAGQASAFLWWPLGPLTLRAVAWSLDAILGRAVFDASRALVGSEPFQVVIVPVCSGFEGVGLMAVFATSYLVLARHQLRFPQALLLLPLGLVAAWIANVTRLVGLVLIGTWFSPQIAVGGFHARAGWVLFSVVALSLVLLAQRTHLFAREKSESQISPEVAAFLLPFLALVATAMVTGLATKHVELLYGVRVLIAIPLLIAFRRFYRDIKWSWSWSALGAGVIAAVAFVMLAPRPDAGIAGAWQQEWLGLPGWGQVSWLIVRVAGSVLVVPAAEELAFRGYLQRRLISREFISVPPGQFSLMALLVSSAAFGVIHHGWLGGTIAGLLFGVVQIRGKNIGQAVLAHTVSNAAIAIYVVGFGQWWVWM